MKNDDLIKLSALKNNPNFENLNKEFQFLINLIKGAEVKDEFILIMNVLVELADKQWNTYEMLPADVVRDLGQSIFEIWDKNSLDSTEKLIEIIAKLGLENTFLRLKSLVENLPNSEVRQTVAAAIIELGDSVNDPYSGMR
jgi:hypothetical protein